MFTSGDEKVFSINNVFTRLSSNTLLFDLHFFLSKTSSDKLYYNFIHSEWVFMSWP